MKKKTLIIILAIFTAGLVIQQSSANPDAKPKIEFDIQDYAWLAGHWKGDGFGGTSEEVWTKPENGVMMGMYRHHNKDGELVFYEFITLDKEGMKLKHFNADMSAWETKEEFVHFEAVEATPKKLVFKGLVFEKKSKREMEVSLRMNRGGKIETEVFHFKRVD